MDDLPGCDAGSGCRMKTAIYYFTGTGNSLAAAQRIAADLGDAVLIPIASLQSTSGEITPQADRVGIVCPVYDCGVPVMVAEFAARLDLSRAAYTFAIVTMGGMGVSALHQLNGIFRERQGRGLDAGFAVRMPGNFPPLYRPPAGKKCDRTLAAADERLGAIAEAIGCGRAVPPRFAPFSTLAKAISYGSFAKSVHEADKDFSVSDACTGCGTCARVCPAGNITLERGRPAWNHRCELCCACLHFCPVEAIQLHVMRGTEGRGRYRHPDLTVADMRVQREGGTF
ncbi:EFR1 family ferrodoxin [Methanoculleus frigidifontis]